MEKATRKFNSIKLTIAKIGFKCVEAELSFVRRCLDCNHAKFFRNIFVWFRRKAFGGGTSASAERPFNRNRPKVGSVRVYPAFLFWPLWPSELLAGLPLPTRRRKDNA